MAAARPGDTAAMRSCCLGVLAKDEPAQRKELSMRRVVAVALAHLNEYLASDGLELHPFQTLLRPWSPSLPLHLEPCSKCMRK